MYLPLSIHALCPDVTHASPIHLGAEVLHGPVVQLPANSRGCLMYAKLLQELVCPLLIPLWKSVFVF